MPSRVPSSTRQAVSTTTPTQPRKGPSAMRSAHRTTCHPGDQVVMQMRRLNGERQPNAVWTNRSEETKGMAVGVEHDADLRLRLMVGKRGALLNSPRRCGLEVLHPDVEVL